MEVGEEFIFKGQKCCQHKNKGLYLVAAWYKCTRSLLKCYNMYFQLGCAKSICGTYLKLVRARIP